MAQIDRWQITYETECYAAVEYEVGFRCGRLKGWKLYSLENSELYMALSQNPRDILAAFETQEELERWRAEVQGAPKPKKEEPTLLDIVPAPKKNGQASLFDLLDERQYEVKPKTIGSSKSKLIISQIL